MTSEYMSAKDSNLITLSALLKCFGAKQLKQFWGHIFKMPKSILAVLVITQSNEI